MIEKIKNNSKFKIEIDGNLYNCYIYTQTYNMGETLGSLTTSFYLVIEKINLKRFLCFNYFSTEWIFKYYIGYNGLFEFNIPYQSIDSERYYDISDVKKWCNKALFRGAGTT